MMSILENNRIKKMMGLLKEDEIIRNVLTSSGLKNDFTFKKDFNVMLKRTFSKTGNWGTANNPQINCFTNNGVIGVYTFNDYSSRFNIPGSNWSVINFFNTSGVVLDQLLEKFRRTDLDETVDNFLAFIEDFINEKLNTSEFEELVLSNLRAISKGIQDENESFEYLKKELNLQGTINFCPGSKTDTRKGEDFVLERNGLKARFQVKPLLFANRYVTITEILTKKYPTQGYSKSDIDYIIFYKNKTKELVIMENDDDIKITNNITSKKGNVIYDKVIFKSVPITPNQIVFK